MFDISAEYCTIKCTSNEVIAGELCADIALSSPYHSFAHKFSQLSSNVSCVFLTCAILISLL